MSLQPTGERPPLRQLQSTPNIALPFNKSESKTISPRSNDQRALSDTCPYALTSVPIPPLDPSRHDPSATFIRWPFRQAVNWTTLERHPNWFLDPQDFNYVGAPPYPTELEPPRGWGPPKAKRGDPLVEIDKAKEENRLRCTFCRRTYGGVNAKSMWRRHVYDKHHVAMRNRRDNGEKGKGKGKENMVVSAKETGSQTMGVKKTESYLSIVNADQTETKERKSTGLPSIDGKYTSSKGQSLSPPATPRIHHVGLHSLPEEPSSRISSSPYDPTRTPQFIHSRPSEPLENALRFPDRSQMLCSLVLSPSNRRRGNCTNNLGSPFSSSLHEGPSQNPPVEGQIDASNLTSLSLRASPFLKMKESGMAFAWNFSQASSSQSSDSISLSLFDDQIDSATGPDSDVFSFFNSEDQSSFLPTLISFESPRVDTTNFIKFRGHSMTDLRSDDLLDSPFFKKRKLSSTRPDLC